MPSQPNERSNTSFFELNRLKKYVSYSLGEIILIVIGILLALQVDNWNEERQQRNIENQALERLAEDLNEDKHRFEMLDASYEQMIVDSKKAVELFGTAKSMQDLEIISKLPSWTSKALAYQTSTYEEMVNTGSLFTIEDKNLLKQITGHYKSLEKYNEYTEENHSSLLKKWDHPAFAPFGDLSLQTMNDGVLYENIEASTKDHSWFINRNSETYKAVNYTLKYHLHTIKMNRDIVLTLIQSTTDLLNLIEESKQST